MGRVDKFMIILANTASQVASGIDLDPNLSHVTGNLHVTLNEAVSVHYVKITLIGESYCRWSTGNGTSSTTHCSRHVLLEQAVQVLPNLYEGSENIAAGSHVFPFSFQFDARSLPSSFKGAHGHIKYIVRAAMDRKGIIFDDKAELELNLQNLPPIDIPPLMTPMVEEDEGNFCCLCCKSGPIIGRVTLSQTGFAPGDKVSVEVLVDNLSSREIIPKLQIVQNVRYRTSHCSTGSRKLVSEEAIAATKLTARSRGMRFSLSTAIFAADVCPALPGYEGYDNIAAVPNITITYCAKVSLGSLKIMIPIYIGQHQTADTLQQQQLPQPRMEPPSYNSIYFYGEDAQ